MIQFMYNMNQKQGGALPLGPPAAPGETCEGAVALGGLHRGAAVDGVSTCDLVVGTPQWLRMSLF